MGEEEATVTGSMQTKSTAGRKRERSQIEFPYSDLERAIDLATVLHREGGQAKIDQTQLAVAMDKSASGGTFRGRVGAARMFGLVETEQGRIGLTPLGLQITDDQTAPVARVEAFLNVPLYSAMFERYQGYALPPAAAIERQMESLGVPTKQKERARQAFSASAQYAGFIASNGRFSKPTIPGARLRKKFRRTPRITAGGGGNDGGDELHPFIQGLLKTLPKPGETWDAVGRANWLNTAASIFTLIYKGNGSTVEVTITPKRENEPPLGWPMRRVTLSPSVQPDSRPSRRAKGR